MLSYLAYIALWIDSAQLNVADNSILFIEIFTANYSYSAMKSAVNSKTLRSTDVVSEIIICESIITPKDLLEINSSSKSSKSEHVDTLSYGTLSTGLYESRLLTKLPSSSVTKSRPTLVQVGTVRLQVRVENGQLMSQGDAHSKEDEELNRNGFKDKNSMLNAVPSESSFARALSVLESLSLELLKQTFLSAEASDLAAPILLPNKRLQSNSLDQVLSFFSCADCWKHHIFERIAINISISGNAYPVLYSLSLYFNDWLTGNIANKLIALAAMKTLDRSPGINPSKRHEYFQRQTYFLSNIERAIVTLFISRYILSKNNTKIIEGTRKLEYMDETFISEVSVDLIKLVYNYQHKLFTDIVSSVIDDVEDRLQELQVLKRVQYTINELMLLHHLINPSSSVENEVYDIIVNETILSRKYIQIIVEYTKSNRQDIMDQEESYTTTSFIKIFLEYIELHLIDILRCFKNISWHNVNRYERIKELSPHADLISAYCKYIQEFIDIISPKFVHLVSSRLILLLSEIFRFMTQKLYGIIGHKEDLVDAFQATNRSMVVKPADVHAMLDSIIVANDFNGLNSDNFRVNYPKHSPRKRNSTVTTRTGSVDMGSNPAISSKQLELEWLQTDEKLVGVRLLVILNTCFSLVRCLHGILSTLEITRRNRMGRESDGDKNNNALDDHVIEETVLTGRSIVTNLVTWVVNKKVYNAQSLKVRKCLSLPDKEILIFYGNHAL